jgi:hypothetical protein
MPHLPSYREGRRVWRYWSAKEEDSAAAKGLVPGASIAFGAVAVAVVWLRKSVDLRAVVGRNWILRSLSRCTDRIEIV